MKTLLMSAGAIALISTAALADPAAGGAEQAAASPQYQAPPENERLMISPIDVTTKDQAQKLADVQFLVADANADGVIDEGEFSAFAADAANATANVVATADGQPADKAFASIAKTDKKITKQELVDARAKSFDAADANRDKVLDPLEQQKFAALVTVKPASASKLQ